MCNRKLFSYFSTITYVAGTQKKPSQLDGSFEQTKQMFKLMDKKIIAIIRKKIGLTGPMLFSNWASSF